MDRGAGCKLCLLSLWTHRVNTVTSMLCVFYHNFKKKGPERKGSHVRCFSDANSKPYFIMQGKVMFLP